jgi:hypothetical protein
MTDTPSTQRYVKFPNLTPDQTRNAATCHTKQTAQHEFLCEVTMAGDSRVNPTMTMTLVGTGTAFDRTYQIMSVIHRISASAGHTMEIVGQADGNSGSGSNPDYGAPQDAFGDAQQTGITESSPSDAGGAGLGVIGGTDTQGVVPNYNPNAPVGGLGTTPLGGSL